MPMCTLSRSLALSGLFIKEQLKEPVALFWMIISPVVTYYLLAYSRGGFSASEVGYMESTSWFYAYISSSVAFFGFSFYIVGRRESGYIRSFVYTPDAKMVFMAAQFLAYSLVALIYSITFYALTYFSYGSFDVSDLWGVISRFYICYILFVIPGVLLGFLPLSFQNTSTVFSIASFIMLVLGILSIGDSYPVFDAVNEFNPLSVANQIMVGGYEKYSVLIFWIIGSFVAVFLLSLRFLRINPVWSRY
ncbi:ABC transporter permease [Pseudomonas umsongensis]|uniref:ABC transporter permease n=1 Tax=Pseudomonas umsongensis TaxID=198618 RepID=UPI003D7F4589